ncbi:MAG: lycopene cyclase family protein [Alphaproteobacteria bacterium]
MQFEQTVDYVVIGGGSAGCVLAARLSEDPKMSVVLLEAGGEDTHPLIHVPAGYVKTMVNPAVNWMFEAEYRQPQADHAARQGSWRIIGD